MTATELIYNAAGRPQVAEATILQGFCYLCGSAMTEGVPLKIALKDSFNNRDMAKRPDGVGFCCACAFSFSEQLEINGRTRQKFRTYTHLVADGKWQPLTKANKAQMLDFLLTPHGGYWLACISESGQKHLLFRCPVNYGPGRFKVLLEEQVIETSVSELSALLLDIQVLMALGASKTAIERGEYLQAFLMKTDIRKWEEIEKSLAPYRGSGPFALALFLAQKLEESDGRNNRDGSEVNSDHSSFDGLVGMGQQEAQILGDVGKRDTVSSVHNRPGTIPQLPLFEDEH